jgi:hypothetical protein
MFGRAPVGPAALVEKTDGSIQSVAPWDDAFHSESDMPATKTSWPKGRSGNPRGRPRSGEELGALLRQMVDHKRFAENVCALRYAGDVQAMRLLLSYTDGLPITRGELQGPEGIQITVTYVQQTNRVELTGCPTKFLKTRGFRYAYLKYLRASFDVELVKKPILTTPGDHHGRIP